ncbi:MAG TPA: hypothetical protein VGE66_02630 [Chitinophagaceae bacterium]
MKPNDLSLSHTRRQAQRRILTIIIMGLGILLIIGNILDLGAFTFLAPWQESIHKFTQVIFFSCIGFIAIMLGLERALDLDRIDKALERQTRLLREVNTSLKSFHEFRYLESYNDIYQTSIQLIEGTHSRLRLLMYTNKPKAPDWWTERVAEIMQENMRRSNPLLFDVVVCVDEDNLSEENIASAEQRYAVFDQKGVGPFFKFHFHRMHKNVGIDCLIIDDRHLIIHFPTITYNIPQRGLLLENQPDVVREWVTWFDNFAISGSLSFPELVASFRSQAEKTEPVQDLTH